MTREQYDILDRLVGGLLTEAAVEGFLVVCSRFVDEFGGHRTEELARIFHTDKPEGKQALIRSLEHMRDWVGGMEEYRRNYTVEIIPARPAFPLFQIVGIETLAPYLFRVLDSTRTVSREDKEPLIDFIARTRRLPALPKQRRPVRRTKPNFHWCSYKAWATPQATREALQILPTWSDCRLRATVLTGGIRRSAYVTFNGDREDPQDERLRFYGYYYEPLAQDHPELQGGGVQIGLEGSPRVHRLELFDEGACKWREIFGPVGG